MSAPAATKHIDQFLLNLVLNAAALVPRKASHAGVAVNSIFSLLLFIVATVGLDVFARDVRFTSRLSNVVAARVCFFAAGRHNGRLYWFLPYEDSAFPLNVLRSSGLTDSGVLTSQSRRGELEVTPVDACSASQELLVRIEVRCCSM